MRTLARVQNARRPVLFFAFALLCGCGAGVEPGNNLPPPTPSVVVADGVEKCPSSAPTECDKDAPARACCGACNVVCSPSETCDGTGCVHQGLLAMGGETCFVHHSGRVICWGKPSSSSQESTQLPTPRLIEGPTQVIDLQSNELRTCALEKSGQTMCWSEGKKPFREFDFGSLMAASSYAGTCTHLSNHTTYCTDPHIHMAAQDARDLTFLRADGGHFYGINRRGQALEWGYLGDLLEVEPAPVRRVEGAGSGTVIQLAFRGQRGCGVRPTGDVFCWERDARGQMKSAPIFGATDGVEVVLGNHHTCYLNRDQRVKCWGDASYGQTGSGSTRSTGEPTTVIGLTQVVHIAAGPHSTCALRKTGAVSCWGSREGGALGDGKGVSVRSPVPISNLTQVTQVSVGASYSCAVTSPGDVWCWGRGPEREGPLQNDRPARALPTHIPLTSPVRSIQVNDSTCAVDIKGEVTCWPSGIPSSATRLSGLPKARSVVLSKTTGMAVLENGKVAKLTLRGELSPPQTPVAVRILPGITNAVTAAWADPAVCVITKSGQVSCLVDDIRGFGGFILSPTSPPPPTPVALVHVSGITKPLAIGAHHDGFTVYQKDGQRVVFDLDSVRTETEAKNLTISDNELWPAHGKVAASAVDLTATMPFSKYYLYCSTQKSAAYCYGTRNVFGELGVGDAIAPTPGTAVLRDVVDVQHSESHACALHASGQVYCWGDNRHAQCGVGGEAYSASPIQVALPE